MRLRWRTLLAATCVVFALLAVAELASINHTAAIAAQQKKPAEKKPAKKRSNLPSTRRAAPMTVAKVNPDSLEQVRIGAARIDQLVAANYAKHGVQPNPLTTDEQFVRRIYLDIVGTIPSYQQARTFLNSRDPGKREKLIDRLLNSPGYVSHYYNYWGDILHLVDRPDPNILAEPYNAWVKEAIRDNVPYDQLVRRMMTASGKVWEDPAVGYLLRDAGMPLDAMNNTVRVFLGTRIGCAQCHDHPFDRWSQKEFYQMAAFTYGVKMRLDRRDGVYKNGNPVTRAREDLLKIDPKNRGGGSFTRLIRANMYSVRDDSRRKLKFPADYQYKDAKPGQLVHPVAMFESPDIGELSERTPREAFADWMTSKQNPRFASTVANRLWHKLFGVGIIDPVDDVQDESVVENEELLAYLTQIVTYLDYDLKEYLRILYNTQTYQRQATTRERRPDEVYHFPGPALRRMTAEQVWDSLLTLALDNPDSIQRPSLDGFGELVDLDVVDASAEQILAKSKEYDKQFGRAAMNAMRKEFGYKGQLLARASELPLPLPPGHFLREFGQGDRELISASDSDGTVPQLLTMFNGPVTHMMLEAGSVIYDNVVKARTTKDRVDVIFLSILAREPSKSDRNLAFKEINARGPSGYGDVIWALINTREFLFIQ